VLVYSVTVIDFLNTLYQMQKNPKDFLIEQLNQSIFTTFGDIFQLETDFHKKRDLNFPFTEIPFFVKTEMSPQITEEYFNYARSLFLKLNASNRGATFFEEHFELIENLSFDESVEWLTHIQEPSVYLSVHNFGQIRFRYDQKTLICFLITQNLESTENNTVIGEFEEGFFHANIHNNPNPLIFFILNQVAINFPLDFLDLIVRISPDMYPGTFNFFLFSALYDLTQNNKDKISDFSDFVSTLNFYKNMIFSDTNIYCPKLTDIIYRGLAQKNVFDLAFDLTGFTALAYDSMTVEEEEPEF
jgi:hypothetical protein